MAGEGLLLTGMGLFLARHWGPTRFEDFNVLFCLRSNQRDRRGFGPLGAVAGLLGKGLVLLALLALTLFRSSV